MRWLERGPAGGRCGLSRLPAFQSGFGLGKWRAGAANSLPLSSRSGSVAAATPAVFKKSRRVLFFRMSTPTPGRVPLRRLESMWAERLRTGNRPGAVRSRSRATIAIVQLVVCILSLRLWVEDLVARAHMALRFGDGWKRSGGQECKDGGTQSGNLAAWNENRLLENIGIDLIENPVVPWDATPINDAMGGYARTRSCGQRITRV